MAGKGPLSITADAYGRHKMIILAWSGKRYEWKRRQRQRCGGPRSGRIWETRRVHVHEAGVLLRRSKTMSVLAGGLGPVTCSAESSRRRCWRCIRLVAGKPAMARTSPMTFQYSIAALIRSERPLGSARDDASSAGCGANRLRCGWTLSRPTRAGGIKRYLKCCRAALRLWNRTTFLQMYRYYCVRRAPDSTSPFLYYIFFRASFGSFTCIDATLSILE